MSFDSERAVSAIIRAAEALVKLRRVRARVKIDVHSSHVEVECKPTLKAVTETAKLAFDGLIDLVSDDGIGHGEGGLYELLVRGIRQVSICEHSFLCSVTRQYESIPWCAEAQPMLRLLSQETERATAELREGREMAQERTAYAGTRLKRESAYSAFRHLQQQGNGRLGEWLLEGQSIAAMPEVVRSCDRLWLVLNVSNDFSNENLRQKLI